MSSLNNSCKTGLSPSGHCGSAAYCDRPYKCCAQCPDKCNSECGFLLTNQKPAEPESTRSTEIVMLPVETISPHPDNPRKDVGDVSELAESIKVNGILQNLTVVPFFSELEERVIEGKYTAIIGHRRLAAAKAAGLKEVPCVIVNLSKDEQISTMITENMQRTDLTIQEQAAAFEQLAMDFGFSDTEIAQKSGFSVSTVRKRRQLAGLPAEPFKAACTRGATLDDFARLGKITDSSDKLKALNAAGTADFNNKIKQAEQNQKYRERIAKYLSEIRKFAAQVDSVSYRSGERFTKICGTDVKINYVQAYAWYSPASLKVEVPKDFGIKQYYYCVSKDGLEVNVYKEVPDEPEAEDDEPKEEEKIAKAQKSEETKKAEAERKADSDWMLLREIEERHASLRLDFILDYTAAKTHSDIILRYLAEAILTEADDGDLDVDRLFILCNIERDEENNAIIFTEEYQRQIRQCPERMMLLIAYAYLEPTHLKYTVKRYNTEFKIFQPKYQENPKLDKLYLLLEELGYERSREELEICAGTHSLFMQNEQNGTKK